MAHASGIRGSRIGSGPMGESERGDRAPSIRLSYWCANHHQTQATFALDQDVQPPQVWDCPRCGLPAGRDQATPPAPTKVEPYKTHLAYVKERRSDAEGNKILDEALAKLRESGTTFTTHGG